MASKFSLFLAELKRRKVHHGAVAYEGIRFGEGNMKRHLLVIPLVFLLCSAFGCQDRAAVAELERLGEAEGLPGFIFSSPAPNSDEEIRILVHYDMEGLSGQDDWRTTHVLWPVQYSEGRELLTADVNAVIEGLFEGGAEEVYVLDDHASGNPNPDIILERMDSRGQIVSWSELPEGTDLGEYYRIDAVAAVGFHSRTGGGGFMAHTTTWGLDYLINGKSVNEVELVMLDWGTSRLPWYQGRSRETPSLPLVFASGDDKLREELRPYPWVEYVTVKFATSASTVELRPVDVVREEMTEAAVKAVKNIPNARAVELKTPFEAGLRAVPPARSLSILRGLPGIEVQDETVTFEAEDYWDARTGGWVALREVARTGHDQSRMRTTRTLLEEHYDRRAISVEINQALIKRWLDYESGR